MKKVLIIDTNQGFTADIERNLIINEIENIDVVTKNSIDDAFREMADIGPDEVVIPVSLIPAGDWNIKEKVVSYARKKEELLVSDEAGIKCYGVITKSNDLLEAIESGVTIDIKKEPVKEKQDIPVAKEEDSDDIESIQTDLEEKKEDLSSKEMPNATAIESMYKQMMEMQKQLQEQMKLYGGQQKAQISNPVKEENTVEKKTPEKPKREEPKKEEESQTRSEDLKKDDQLSDDIRKEVDKRRKREQERVRQETEDLAKNSFDEDMGKTKKKAKCITVYAAKGGVGKTTISCELATFLALTSSGRGKLKVCIADFNIDFGDVLTTLSFDAKGPNMTTWAADIRERLKDGEKVEDIQYSEARIMTWMQRNEKDGLYALLAPTSNADSAEISEKEIEVMIHNLIYNCGFDFVICDTGNNTRDSSFIALEEADNVILVQTQDVNTANCNNSFLQTADRIRFDMNKFSIVINKVLPAKVVGITTEELESAFRNPNNNGRPYDCIAKIRSNNDVINSGNMGEPLVYDSQHEFTKSIAEIVQYITGNKKVLQKTEEKKEPKKKGFHWFSKK